MDPFTMALLGGSVGTAIGGFGTSMFGSDPYEEAMKYMDDYYAQLGQHYDPYIQHGMSFYPELQRQYMQMMTSPGSVQQSLGSSYQASPGYQYQMDQAMNAGNMAAAAGGMTGSPAHQKQMMNTAANIANQDYYNYLGNQLGIMNQGIAGAQGMYNTGYGATTNKMNDLGNYYSSMAQMAAAQAQAENEATSGLFGAVGSLVPSFF